MPILSIYLGTAETSFLKFNTYEDYDFRKYPYSYSPELFGHFITGEKFYNGLLSEVCKDWKINLKDYEVVAGVVSGCNYLPDCQSAVDVMVKMKDLNWISLNNFWVANPGGLVSYMPVSAETGEFHFMGLDDSDLVDLFSNTSIYPQACMEGFELDSLLEIYASRLEICTEEKRLTLITGERMNTFRKRESESVLLIMDLIKMPGLFDINIDLDNTFPTLALLQSNLESRTLSQMDMKYTKLTALLNTPGGAEVLVETDVGTSQIVEVEDNEIFLVPLEEGAKARIVLSHSQLGEVESYITGGRLGLVIDAREKTKGEFLESTYRRKHQKSWLEVLENRPQGLE